MKKVALKEIDAILGSLEKLGLLRRIGSRNGQTVWGLVSPDDFRCRACGGNWAGIQTRVCRGCAEVVRIKRSTAQRSE